MAYCSQGNHTKFGNRMNYIKEKTEPYHISISHFLCHCITDSFLPIDIQPVLFVIYARFLYHYGITTLHWQLGWETGIPLIHICILVYYK